MKFAADDPGTEPPSCKVLAVLTNTQQTAAVVRDAALKRAETQLETIRREAAKLAREEFQAERLALEEEIWGDPVFSSRVMS